MLQPAAAARPRRDVRAGAQRAARRDVVLRHPQQVVVHKCHPGGPVLHRARERAAKRGAQRGLEQAERVGLVVRRGGRHEGKQQDEGQEGDGLLHQRAHRKVPPPALHLPRRVQHAHHARRAALLPHRAAHRQLPRALPPRLLPVPLCQLPLHPLPVLLLISTLPAAVPAAAAAAAAAGGYAALIAGGCKRRQARLLGCCWRRESALRRSCCQQRGTQPTGPARQAPHHRPWPLPCRAAHPTLVVIVLTAAVVCWRRRRARSTVTTPAPTPPARPRLLVVHL